MNQPIHIGDRGTTVGPLNPTGRIRIGSKTIDASSQGNWIDGDVQVVIVAGTTRQAIVRIAVANEETKRGVPLSVPTEIPETPLQSPPANVERLHFPIIGFVVGVVLLAVVWGRGTGLSIFALTVPLSGYVSGWLLRALVGTATEFAGPREDHRPKTNAIVLFVLLGAALGVSIGFSVGTGYIGVSMGLFAGVLVTGVLAYFVNFMLMV